MEDPPFEVSNSSPTELGIQSDWLRSKQLCEKCHAVFEHWHMRQAAPDLKHHSIDGLTISAGKGCPICDLFLQSWTPVVGAHIRSKFPHSTTSVKWTCRWAAKENEKWHIGLRVDEPSESSPTVAEIYVYRAICAATQVDPLSPSSDSPIIKSLSKGWLNLCRQSHKSCGLSVDEGVQPTRLLSISDSGVHLCLAGDLPGVIEYATLSHCWGDNKFTTLTSHNLEAFLIEIPAEALTLTFRHAIAIAIDLGFKYIWIDSLCIIQNNEADWRIESAKMGGIYANSTLNIMASDSPSGDIGCRFQREAGKITGWKVDVSTIAQTSMLNTVSSNSIPEESTATSPLREIWDCLPSQLYLGTKVLHSRGWVFQEAFLSSRQLSLGREVSWTCREHSASEAFQAGVDMIRTDAKYLLSTKVNKQNIGHEWMAQVVFEFSKRLLTYDSDKLVAVAGIARIYSEATGTQYVAGLWKNHDFLKQILWVAENPTSRPASYVAPTWSWASSKCKHVWPMTGSKSFAIWPMLDSVSTTPVADIFGSVLAGTLSLFFGDIAYGEIKGTSSYQGIIGESGNSLEMSVKFDYSPPILEGKFYFFPVAEMEPDNGRELWGVVLERVVSLRYTYKRVGIFHTSPKKPEEIEDFKNISRTRSWKVGDDVAESVGSYPDGAPVFRITII